MPKRLRIVDAYCMYRRQGTDTIYARDESGRYNAYRLVGRDVRILPGAITTLAPIYGRVDFANEVRFTGRTRSQAALRGAYDSATAAQKITSGWVDLPPAIAHTRRPTNQGMNGATLALTGATCSATRYAIWVDGQHPTAGINAGAQWEWCHLLAHGMHGADNETNIVAARKGNNSEQLAIESALQMYRMERMFQMKISAARAGVGHARYIGNVIKYKVRCIYGGAPFECYLDCLNAPSPSQIHFYGLLHAVAAWANAKLVQVSQQVYQNALTAEERRLVMQYIDEH